MLREPDGNDYKTQQLILQAFSRALTREAHILRQHPNLLWQQRYNRLLWEGDVKDK
jgi:hypothetical protein